jgi:hypothetical protein
MTQRRLAGNGWRIDWIPDVDRLRQYWDKSGIYFIVCKPTRIGYIGSAKRFSHRLKYHFGDLGAGTHVNRKMQAAFNQYGVDNFDWGIVEECSIHSLEAREQYWINRYPPERLFNAQLKVVRNQADIIISKAEAQRYIEDYMSFDISDVGVYEGWIEWHLVTDTTLKNQFYYWFPFWLEQESLYVLAGRWWCEGKNIVAVTQDGGA